MSSARFPLKPTREESTNNLKQIGRQAALRSSSRKVRIRVPDLLFLSSTLVGKPSPEKEKSNGKSWHQLLSET